MIKRQKNTQSGVVASIRNAFSRSNTKLADELSKDRIHEFQHEKGLSRKKYGPRNTISSRNRHAKSTNDFPASELD